MAKQRTVQPQLAPKPAYRRAAERARAILLQLATQIDPLGCVISGICLVMLMHALGALSAAEQRVLVNMEETAAAQNALVKAEHAQTRLLIEETRRDTADSISTLSQQLTRLERTYNDLLAAQRRRTLESLYDENTVTAAQREGAAAFRQGRYLEAYRLYGQVLDAHADNSEARFYRFYALFLNNKAERNNYSAIQEAFQTLERSGYTRRELQDTLGYIEAELNPPVVDTGDAE
jgi:tetratricopeptide (TPR) repeat protein